MNGDAMDDDGTMEESNGHGGLESGTDDSDEAITSDDDEYEGGYGQHDRSGHAEEEYPGKLYCCYT